MKIMIVILAGAITKINEKMPSVSANQHLVSLTLWYKVPN